MGLEKEVQAAQGALGRGRGDVLRPLEEGRLEARKVREVHFEGWVLVDSALLVRVSRALVGPVLAGQNAAVVLGVAERNYGGVGNSEKARLARAVGKELAPSVTFMIAPTFSTASTSGPVENWAQPGQRASVHASTGTGCAALLYAVASVGRRSVESVRDTVMAADFNVLEKNARACKSSRCSGPLSFRALLYLHGRCWRWGSLRRTSWGD